MFSSLKVFKLFLVTALICGIFGASTQRAAAFDVIGCQPLNLVPAPCLSGTDYSQIISLSQAGAASLTTLYSSAVLEGNVQVPTATKTLVGISITPTVAGFILIVDSASITADGAIAPKICLATPTINSTYGFALNVLFTTRITIMYSTTGCFTKTASATAYYNIWSQ